MAAITKTWTDVADSALNPDAPITTTLMYAMRDDLQFLHEWMGFSYYPGAVQDHNHDGVNSALVPIGPNSLRNGSFESGTAGWTITQFTGGTVAIDTTNEMDGAQCLAITSTVLANGGGQAQTSEYEVVGGSRRYSIRGLAKASVANVSSSVDVVWFDATKAQISVSNVYNSANTPTAATEVGGEVSAPANARYKQLRVTGGVAGVGTAVGTVYFDGFIAAKSVGGLIKFTQITASGTFTPEASTKYMLVLTVGGGGGSSGSASSNAGHPGRGAPMTWTVIAGPLAASYTATIGAGGPGGATNGGTGSQGGTTSLGPASAPGGYGGVGYRGAGTAGDAGTSSWGPGGPGNTAAAANTGAGAGAPTAGTLPGLAGGSGIILVWEFA